MDKILILILLIAFVPFTSSEFVELENETVWTQYSPNKSLDNPSNKLNVITKEDIVEDLKDAGWTKSQGDERYAFINNSYEQIWKKSDIQMEKGTYHGKRDHVRIYRSPWSNHSVIQAHREYFNWLTLRHKVTSNSDAKKEIEKDIDSSSNSEGSRILYLLLGIGLLSYSQSRRQKTILIVSTALLMPLVRLTGVLLSTTDLHPYIITGMLYPVLVGIIFYISAIYSRRINGKREKAGLVILGMSIGFLIDNIYLSGFGSNNFLQIAGFIAAAGFMTYSSSAKRLKIVSKLSYIAWLSLILLGYIS